MRITLGQRVEFMRQGEHQMEVGYGQQFGAPGGEPAFLGERLALRAMPVAAGVVVVAQRPASLAVRDMATECLGAARLNRAQRPVLHR